MRFLKVFFSLWNEKNYCWVWVPMPHKESFQVNIKAYNENANSYWVITICLGKWWLSSPALWGHWNFNEPLEVPMAATAQTLNLKERKSFHFWGQGKPQHAFLSPRCCQVTYSYLMWTLLTPFPNHTVEDQPRDEQKSTKNEMLA